jgi:hypothetical protein
LRDWKKLEVVLIQMVAQIIRLPELPALLAGPGTTQEVVPTPITEGTEPSFCSSKKRDGSSPPVFRGLVDFCLSQLESAPNYLESA